jgi:hypothetical protein
MAALQRQSVAPLAHQKILACLKENEENETTLKID